ncbi:MAG: tetratricopeptide repeat protein [Bacteroidota bacterium]
MWGYFFAILSKETALAILGVVPLVLYFFTNTSLQKITTQTVFFGVVAAVYFAIRMNIVDSNPEPFGIIDNSLFAIDTTFGRLATAIGMVGEYFKLLIFPHPLSFDYSYNTFPELGWGNWKVLTSLVSIIGLAYVAIKGLAEKNLLSFCILFFAITFGITSNIFFLIGATFAERFMFVPSLGFCLAVSYLFHKYLKAEKSKPPTSFYVIIGVFVLLYFIKTFSQNKVWKSDETLFATGIHVAPNSTRTQSFYGVMNYRKALLPENANRKNELLQISEEYLKKSLATYSGFTEAYQHLAATYEAQNRLELSLQTYKDALKTKPDYFPAMTNYGIVAYKLKRYAEAESYLQQSLEYAPNNITTIRALGLTYREQGKFNLAIQEFEKALDAYYTVQHLTDLGMTYEQMGDPAKAQFYNQKILEFKQQ